MTTRLPRWHTAVLISARGSKSFQWGARACFGLGSLMVIALGTAGCSQQSTLEIPQDGPTTLEVYQRHVGGYDEQIVQIDDSADVTPVKSSPQGALEVAHSAENGATLTATLQAARVQRQRDFPLLPNREFTLFVFPHLTSSGNPIPAYTTVWRLYEKDHYALPGEVIAPD